MKIFIIFFFLSSNVISSLTFEELDYIRSIANKDSISIIESGTRFCNDFFEKNFPINEYKYKNFFTCKFSKIRNRFYIYKLAVEKKDSTNLKEFCSNILLSWPEIFDHMDENFKSQKKDYLNGFYVDNFFFDKVIDFSNKYDDDQRIITNEINIYILKNRNNFSNDNVENNILIKKEINKINKIYKKIISESKSDLDNLIIQILNNVVRYKIFINDIKNFKSYSCNWTPGKGIEPYVKRERFSEFENI